MSDFHPLVSIVIPVYNGANYMREAIDSALAQTYDNCEVIVVNDGSRDEGETDRIARSYGDKIRYFAKENGGVATALNLAIREMHGEYFSWLSHDDVYLPEKVERQIAALQEVENKKNILFSDYCHIDSQGRHEDDVRLPDISAGGMFCYLYENSLLHGCSLLIPAGAFGAVGFFAENLPTTQDYELWLSMSRGFPFVHVKEILVQSRRHAEQGSAVIPGHLNEVLELFRRHLAYYIEQKAQCGSWAQAKYPIRKAILHLLWLRAGQKHYFAATEDVVRYAVSCDPSVVGKTFRVQLAFFSCYIVWLQLVRCVKGRIRQLYLKISKGLVRLLCG